MTDGYEGDGALAREPRIEHLDCLGNVRQKFVGAVKVQPKGKRSLADQAVDMIGKRYLIEHDSSKKPAPGKQTVRQDPSGHSGCRERLQTQEQVSRCANP
jgi:hypothetical protein